MMMVIMEMATRFYFIFMKLQLLPLLGNHLRDMKTVIPLKCRK